MSFPKCGICEYEYSDEAGYRVPKTLKCSHSLCASCAEKLVNNCSIECPFCRVKTNHIVNNDVETLQKNFGLLDFIQTLKQQSDEVYVNSPPQCKSHPYNLAEFVCINSDCSSEDKLMCRTCEDFGKHKSHTKGLLIEEGLKIRNRIGDQLNDMKNQKEKIESHLEKLHSVRSSYVFNGANYAMVVNRINLHFEGIRRAVDEKEEMLLQTLRDKSIYAIEKVDELLSNEEFDIIILNERIDQMNKLLANNDSELFAKSPCVNFGKLRERLMEPPEPLTDEDVQLPSINFEMPESQN